MPDYHAAAELAPRDVVSRAVFERMVETEDTSVYLDLSDLTADPHAQFPGISRICRFFGIDIARDPIPVRPGAHYMVGGLEVGGGRRDHGAGACERWGECASTGLHGANRMGSNSLLEALVLGWQTGEAAAREASHEPLDSRAVLVAGPRPEISPAVEVNLDDVIYSLKSLMWRQMGRRARRRQAHRRAGTWCAFWSRGRRPPRPAVAEGLGAREHAARQPARRARGPWRARSRAACTTARTTPRRATSGRAHLRLVPRVAAERDELLTVDLERAPAPAPWATRCP